ncbi:MAG TPA: protocatechuate 3,4-dioxygenase subunit alpha [Candidatus Limnocylindrales bacterium]
MTLPRTPSQTVGPYLALGLPWPDGPFVVADGTPGAIWIRGRLIDGAGDPLPDALVETWQADDEGRFAHPAARRAGPTTFRGFGRCPTDADGRYAILTIKPAPVPGADGRLQAPHIDVTIFARGLLKQLVTRLYFSDEPAANAADPALLSIDDRALRATLLAERSADGYRFDVHLQGDRETVFFDV